MSEEELTSEEQPASEEPEEEPTSAEGETDKPTPETDE
jgi:hypothetical protein